MAPVLLIGGWTVAQARQPAGFDAVRDTISALAALGATDRWIMTSALAGVGACHLATALGLRAAALPGRVVLGIGGLATLLVAALPLPADAGPAVAHGVVAGIAFGSLGLWPALSWRPLSWCRGRPALALRRSVALAAAGLLLLLVGWFVTELVVGGRVGLAERCAAGAQALWPFVAVLSVRRAARRG
jgi:hypothetical membrane protein